MLRVTGAVCLLACLACGSAKAQSPPPDIEQLSRNLEDSEQSFQFAQGAVAAGDIRGAIAALERVLQINPDLANIRLELGLLYLQAGQADLARSYLEAAVNEPDAPEEARTRARRALREAGGRLDRFGVSGFLSLSGQHQTNPNGSPDAVSVAGVGGLPVIISGDQLQIPRGSDQSLTASAAIEMRLGLGGQRGNELVLNLTGVGTAYSEQNEIDVGYLSARLGPRVYFGAAGAPSSYLRPYLSATHLSLGRATYYEAVGAGVTGLRQQALKLALEAEIAYERRDYNPSRLRTSAEDQTGDYWSGAVNATWQLSPRTRLSLGGAGERAEARREFWSRTTLGVEAGGQHALDLPFGSSASTVRVSAGYQHSNYDEPDPFIDPRNARKEDRISLELGISVPLGRAFALDGRAQQTWTDANLPNYEFNNTLVALGASYRF